MARRRVRKVHGEKIAKARAETKLDQESFARSAGVSVRTLQRAENSEMISPSKVAQIAGALRVNPEELIEKSLATTNNIRSDGYGTLTLKPIRSYKDMQKSCLTHWPERLDLDYQVSPEPEQIEKIATVIKDIQSSIEFMASGAGEGSEWGDPFDYAAKFKKDMEFTQNLRDLRDGGIFMFAGHYTNRALQWTKASTVEGFKHFWLSQQRTIAVLRFYDEKSIEQSSEITERVFFGLSKDIMEGVALIRSGDENITFEFFTQIITADDQIDPVVLDDLITFSEPIPGN